MAELTDAEIDAALERGRLLKAIEPRAGSARYDRELGLVIVELTNGAAFSFPPHLVQGFQNATEDQLSGVTTLGAGYGLHWDELDVDLSLPGIMAGIFGTRHSMARKAGQVTSSAKAKAARANGAKGGRPRKSASR